MRIKATDALVILAGLLATVGAVSLFEASVQASYFEVLGDG